MTLGEYAIVREAMKLREFPDARYEGWRRITQAADRILAAPSAPPARRIPLTSHEQRQQGKRTGAELQLQKAAAKLREAGYRVSPPKVDDELDAAARTWLQEQHG